YPLALATSLYSASPVFGNDAAPGKAPSSRAYEIECNLKRAEQGKIRLEDVFSEGFEKPGKPENVFKHRTEDHRTIEARLVKTSYDGPSSTYTETLKTPANDVEGATRGYQYKVDGFLKEILERDPKALESLGTILTKTHKVDKDRTIIENLEDRYRLNGTEECWKEYFDEYRAETPDDQESSKGFNEYLTSIVRFTRSLKILRDERDKLRKGDYAPFTRSGSGEEFDARYNNVKNGLNDEVVAFFDELLAGFNIDDLKLNIGNIEKNIQERATQIKAAEQSKKNCSYNIIQHGSEKTRLDRETNESKDRDKKPMENIKRLFGGRNESEYRDQLGVQKVKVGNLMAEENVKQEQAEKDLNDHT
ncbi:MAG TPA: hypothetical protein VJB06_02740, partial [archaeon]|nr:hypothetical protein [archaeon]